MSILTTQNFGARQPAIANIYSIQEGLGCRINWALIPDSFLPGAVKVQINGTAAQGATSIPVDPLPVPLPLGAKLHFDSGEFAFVTAAAPKGATTVTVEALVNGLEDNDFSTYLPLGAGKNKVVPALTVMAYLSDGSAIPRALTTGSEVASFLLASEAQEGAVFAGYTGYGSIVGGEFYENLLPDSSGGVLPTLHKTELQANSLGFLFFPFVDSRTL